MNLCSQILGTNSNSVLAETQAARIPAHRIGLACHDEQSQVEWDTSR